VHGTRAAAGMGRACGLIASPTPGAPENRPALHWAPLLALVQLLRTAAAAGGTRTALISTTTPNPREPIDNRQWRQLAGWQLLIRTNGKCCLDEC
jgi:hypothetical protein